MKNLKYLSVIASFMLLVGCGESTNDSSEVSAASSTTTKKELSFSSLSANVDGNISAVDVNSSAYDTLQTVKLGIQKIQNGGSTSSSINSKAISFEYDLSSIPARLQLANELLKTITITSTSEDYRYKSSAVLGQLTLKITAAIFAAVSPFSTESGLAKQISDLEAQLVKVKNTPNQKDTEYANINYKEDLAKVLRSYRSKSSNIEDSNAKAEFDAYLLKATGARLSFTTTVGQVKTYMSEIPTKYDLAMNVGSEDSVDNSDAPLTAAQIKSVFNLIETGSSTLEINNLSSDVKAQVKKLMDFFGGLGILKDVEIAGTDLSFSVSSLNDRTNLGLDIINTIVLSANNYKFKKQEVHTQIAFQITSALIVATSPLSTNNDLKAAQQALKNKVTWANKQGDLSANSTATIYVKEAMAKQLREYRTYQYGILKNKSDDIISAFNDKILDATGVRLDPTASIQKVYDTLAELKTLATEAKNSPDDEDKLNVASFSDKVRLSNMLTKARFTSGVGFSSEDVKAGSKVYWDSGATVNEVNNAIATLEKAIAIANGEETEEAETNSTDA